MSKKCEYKYSVNIASPYKYFVLNFKKKKKNCNCINIYVFSIIIKQSIKEYTKYTSSNTPTRQNLLPELVFW